jgi:hypothetical protein
MLKLKASLFSVGVIALAFTLLGLLQHFSPSVYRALDYVLGAGCAFFVFYTLYDYGMNRFSVNRFGKKECE